MSHRRRTESNFVAYRLGGDECRIRFLGGPLDGAEIRTDVYPDAETFVHRVGSRDYIYAYEPISGDCFHAVYRQVDPLGKKKIPCPNFTWRQNVRRVLLSLLMLVLSGLGAWLLLLALRCGSYLDL
jgi:hypothetical protein